MKNLILLMLVVIGLAACSTIEGLGKDMQSAGEALEKKAAGVDDPDKAAEE